MQASESLRHTGSLVNSIKVIITWLYQVNSIISKIHIIYTTRKKHNQTMLGCQSYKTDFNFRGVKL